MAIDFSYKITELIKAPSLGELDNVVTGVSFVYSGEDTTSGTRVDWNTISIPVPAPDAENFTAFEELTEAEVINWVETIYPIGPVTEAITQKIADLDNPKEVVTDLPWAPAATTEPDPLATDPKA